MKKIKQWLLDNKITIISVIVLLTIFFLVISLLNNNYVKPIKAERNQIKLEKQELLKQIKSLNDSISFYSELSKEAIIYDTVIINKIIKEKQKTNVQISIIPYLGVDSNSKLFSKLINEYIQTGFAPDSSQ